MDRRNKVAQPAFPRSEYGDNGMDLRDWFAGQALTSVMATASNMSESNPDERDEAFRLIAGWMYEMADAMMEARKA